MKKYIFTFIAPVVLFVACQNNKTAQTDHDTVAIATDIAASSTQACYSYLNKKDTASLTFMSSSNIITGELTYKLYEKDINKGIIKGEFRGDTLIADYTFNAEGRESIRQIVFLKKGNQLIEGYGEIQEKEGKTSFKEISKLTFGQSIIFTKVDCN